MLVTDGPRCTAHRQAAYKRYDNTTRKDDPRLAMAKRIRSSAQWRDVEQMHKALNPLCCDPFREHGHRSELTQQSHHVASLIERPDLAYTWANLAPICTACHSRVEAMERAGKSTAALFTRIAIRSPFGDVQLGV